MSIVGRGARGLRRAAGRRGARRRSRGHALVDLGRRGGGGRRVRQGVRRHRQQVGRRRDRRLGRHGAADHDQPHHRRRPDGRDPVQPRPPGRGAGRGRADARPDRRRRRRRTGRRSSTRRRCSTPARSTARSTACRSTSTPGSGCGCRTRRSRTPASPVPTNWDEFVAAAPALRGGRQDPARHGQAALAGVRRLQRADAGARPARALQQGLRRQGRRGRRPGRRWRRSSRPPTTRARWRRSRTSRTGTRRPTWSSPTQAGGQIMGDWAQGEFQVAGQVAGRTTPACPASACNEVLAHRRRRLLLPADRGRGDQRRRRPSSPR